MISNIELEVYQRITELEGISFIECNKDVLDLLKIIYLKVADLREINKIIAIKNNNIVENFKNYTHLLKTLESKCDKKLNRFEHELMEKQNEIDNLKNEFLDLHIETNSKLRKCGNVIIINYWVSVLLFAMTLFSFIY
jgi:hypothetical protein